MGLHSVFEAALGQSDSLQRIESSVWQCLCATTASHRHAWHHGVLNTVALSAGMLEAVNSRTVILRAANPNAKTVECHTDARSQKVADLNHCAVASWTFYDHQSKIQVRLNGNATVINDQFADEAWNRTSLCSRASYLSISPPGQSVDSIKPPLTDDRRVSQEESERGRQHFRVVHLQVKGFDRLYLRRTGHLRMNADYCRVSGETTLRWLVP